MPLFCFTEEAAKAPGSHRRSRYRELGFNLLALGPKLHTAFSQDTQLVVTDVWKKAVCRPTDSVCHGDC